MITFSYVCKFEHKQRKGKIEASCVNDAIEKLKKMDICPFLIGEEGKDLIALEENKNKYNNPDNIIENNKLDDINSKNDTITHEEPDGQEDSSILIIDKDIEDNHTNENNINSGNITKNTTEQKQSTQNSLNIHSDKKEYIDIRRQHKVIFGEYEKIKPEIDNLLALKFGEVKHMSIQSDMRGKILMAIAIEYDVPIQQNKEKSQ